MGTNSGLRSATRSGAFSSTVREATNPVPERMNHNETLFARAAADLKSIGLINTGQADPEPLYAVPEASNSGPG